MMTYILVFVAGVVAWQLVTTAVLLITDENHEATMFCGCGLPLLLLNCVGLIVRKIRKTKRSKNFKAALVDAKGRLCYCNSNEADMMLDAFAYQWAEKLRSEYTPDDGWDKEVCFRNTVNLRYTPMAILKEKNAYPIKKEVIEMAEKLVKPLYSE